MAVRTGFGAGIEPTTFKINGQPAPPQETSTMQSNCVDCTLLGLLQYLHTSLVRSE